MFGHRAQIFQVEQQQSFVIRNFENDAQHAALRFIQSQQARQQQRTHIRNRRAYGMPFFAKHIPKNDGIAFCFPIFQFQLFNTRVDFGIIGGRGLTDAGQIAFDVRAKHGHADARKTFGDGLQRHRFARAGCARNQAVTVCHVRQ